LDASQGKAPHQFTARSVATAGPGRHHAGVKGLYLYVGPEGRVRRWIFRYTSPSSRRVTETGLGMTYALPLADARKKALELERLLANGTDPLEHKRRQAAAAITFAEATEKWLAIRKASWRSASQLDSAHLLLRRYAEPLSNLPVSAITPDQIQAALADLWDRGPAQGWTALSRWERVFDWAKAHGLRTGDSPAAWRGCMEYRFPGRRTMDVKHYAALPYEKVPDFIQ